MTLDPSRQQELMRSLFHEVQFDTFEAYDDPRCNVKRITQEAFTRTLPRLPDGVGVREAYERLMDVSMQLAADDLATRQRRCGPCEVHLIPLVSLYGFRFCEVDDEFRPWLGQVDRLPQSERAVYRLIASLGWTNARTAEVLGRSEGWTSKLMKRARHHLADAGVSVEELQTGFFDVETERRKEKACLM
ncbi:sigma-70 region 4 domain-containing protein [Streptomyces sp. A012304]|uniref:sigma-70 region 4 domain-containing protein n=1 Tax=Streptomyces sp. A012304 TaxID=375446 RepID=UPI00222E127D|nr:sigma-70 region 4 domain-containing protein [Streptomyces sp. A012304]GKQ39426.1 hypothetical protein ALMP_59530 [Streptomyces sp. A012304]